MRLKKHEKFKIEPLVLGLDCGGQLGCYLSSGVAFRAAWRADGHWNRRGTGNGRLLSGSDDLERTGLDSSTIATTLKEPFCAALCLPFNKSLKEKLL